MARRFVFTCVASLLTILTIPIASASDSGILLPTLSEAFSYPPDPPQPRTHGQFDILFPDAQNSLRNFSALLNTETPGMETNSDPETDPTCSSYRDSSCATHRFRFTAVIPVCDEIERVNCIVEVGALNDTGQQVKGQFANYFPRKSQNGFTGAPEKNVPSGGSPALFTFPGLSHRGGNQFLVRVLLAGSGTARTNRAVIDRFEANIVPVQIQSEYWHTGCSANNPTPQCHETGWVNMQPPGVNHPVWTIAGLGTNANSIECAEESAFSGQCAVPFGFPSGNRFYMKLRLSRAITGWLHGRLSDPVISITQSGMEEEIYVEGAPVNVPVVYKQNYWKEIPVSLQNLYDPSTGCYRSPRDCTGWSGFNSTDPTQRDSVRKVDPFFSGGNRELNLWSKYLGDKAYASVPTWSVRSLSSEEVNNANSCLGNISELVGMVTTNATQYSPGPPSFDSKSGALLYQVTSTHFTPSGEIFLGTYDLVMRSDVARCLYDFSKAPVSAKIEILSEDGSPQVATTSLSEKDGWLHLAASGFTYSSPTLKVKLEQIQPAAPTPVASTPVTEISVGVSKTIPRAAPIQKSITCVKGKTIKKVTAVNPKCPVGYKKK